MKRITRRSTGSWPCRATPDKLCVMCRGMMRAQIILIVVAVFGVFVPVVFSQSRLPPPSPFKGTELIVSQSFQSGQATTQNQYGTEQKPLVVRVLPGVKGKVETVHETRERDEKSTNERWVTWATIWLAIVTTFLAIFTAYLWDTTRKLAKSAEDTAKRQLRAFIFGKGINFAPHIWDGTIKEYVFWVTWENVGLTPGTDVCNWMEIKTFPANQEQEIFFTPSDQRRPAVMGPRATTQTGYVTVPLETSDDKDGGMKRRYLFGLASNIETSLIPLLYTTMSNAPA